MDTLRRRRFTPYPPFSLSPLRRSATPVHAPGRPRTRLASNSKPSSSASASHSTEFPPLNSAMTRPFPTLSWPPSNALRPTREDSPRISICTINYLTSPPLPPSRSSSSIFFSPFSMTPSSVGFSPKPGFGAPKSSSLLFAHSLSFSATPLAPEAPLCSSAI